MQYSPAIAKVCCAVCLALALLVTMGFNSCAVGDWQLLTTDAIRDGLAISDLSFIDANRGWVLTPAQLLETTDGGQTWTERLHGEGKSFYSLKFVNPTTGWIVGTQKNGDGYSPLIMQTTDGGKTWRPQAVDVAARRDARVAPRLQSVSFCSSDVGWAVGSDIIVHTTNGGQTWEVQRGGNKDEVLIGVECLSPERAWAVGENGVVLFTEDGGRHWSSRESGTQATLLRVRFFQGHNGWIVGLHGTLLRTRDGGEKWERQQLGVSESLMDIYINDSQGWIVGTEGTILHTKDGGQRWQKQESPTANDLVSLSFINLQQGWAGGDKRTLLRFTD